MTTQPLAWNVTSPTTASIPDVRSSPPSNWTLTELNDHMALTLLPAMIYVGVLMTIGIFGNAVVCYVFCRKMPKGTQNFLVLCLAVFDLLSCVIAMPTEIVDMREFYLFQSEIACKMLRFVNVFTAIASIFTLLIIAVDRYKNVLRPFQHQMSLRSAHRSVILVLIGSFAFSWPAFALYGIHQVEVGIPGEMGRDCSTDDAMRGTIYPLIYSAVQFLGFVLISAVLLVVYVRILRETRRHYRYLRDTSDFYYVTGSVARSEVTPGVALISDSRLNLNEYFPRDNDRYRSFGRVLAGIENAAFSAEDCEDTVSPERERPPAEKSSPKMVKQMTSPVLMRRLKTGRNNAKYFISPHADSEVVEDWLRVEARWNKSVSTPNFDQLMSTSGSSPRDVRSEGKPTPLQSRRFLKRQISVRSCGHRSTNNSIIEIDLRQTCNNLSQSDAEIIIQAMRQHRRQLTKGLSESNISRPSVWSAAGETQTVHKSVVQLENRGSDTEINSEVSHNMADNAFTSGGQSSQRTIGKAQKHRAPNQMPSLGFPPLSHSAPATPRSVSHTVGHSKVTVAGGSSPELQGYGQLFRSDHNYSKLGGHSAPERTTTQLATPSFFLPQNDEGIDMSFEMDDDVTEGSGLTLAVCPRCQTHFSQTEGSQGGPVTELTPVTTADHGGTMSRVNSSANTSDKGSPSRARHRTLRTEQKRSETFSGPHPQHSRRQRDLDPGTGTIPDLPGGQSRDSISGGVASSSAGSEGKPITVTTQNSANGSMCSLNGEIQSQVGPPTNTTWTTAAQAISDISQTGQFCPYHGPNTDTCVTSMDVTEDKTCLECSVSRVTGSSHYCAHTQQRQKPPRVRAVSESQTVLSHSETPCTLDTANVIASNDNNSNSNPVGSSSALNIPVTTPSPAARKRPLVRAKSESLSFYKMVLENSMKTSEKKTIRDDTNVAQISANEDINSCSQLSDLSAFSLCDESGSVEDECSLCNLPTDTPGSIVRSQRASSLGGKTYSPSLSRTRAKNSPDSRTGRRFSSSGGGALQVTPRAACRYLKSNFDWMALPSATSIRPDSAPRPSSATSIAVCVTSVFILSFLPHLCLMLARVLKPNFDDDLTGSNLVLFNIFLRSYLANSALNPFVYGWLNQQFRHHCCQILRLHCSCCTK